MTYLTKLIALLLSNLTLGFLQPGALYAQDTQIREQIDNLVALNDALTIEIGPLADGESYEFVLRIAEIATAARISGAGAANRFAVEVPAGDIIKTILVYDLASFVLNHPGEAEAVREYGFYLIFGDVGVDRYDLFHERHPDVADVYAEHMKSYNATGTQTLIVNSMLATILLHEVCHGILGHLEHLANQSDQFHLQQERMADGCAWYLEKRYFDALPIGILVKSIGGIFSNEMLGQFSVTHPSVICRSGIAFRFVLDFVWEKIDNMPDESSEFFTSIGASSREEAKNYYKDIIPKVISSRQYRECDDYNRDFSAGYYVMEDLVDDATLLLITSD